MLNGILERYAIANAEQIKFIAGMDGVLRLTVDGGEDQDDITLARVGVFTPTRRFSDLKRVEETLEGVSMLLSDELIARIILTWTDPERARSSFWEHEDWYCVEAESI